MTVSADFIRLINAKVNIYHNAKICGNWQVDASHLGRTCFHVVTEGHCKLSQPTCNSITLNKGDMVLFPCEIEHTLLPIEHQNEAPRSLSYSDQINEKTVGLLCASVDLNAGAGKYLLEAMPQVLVLRNDDTAPWLAPLNTLLQMENYQGGALGGLLIQRLCELLFVYALTHCLKETGKHASLLKLYAHPKLNMALEAIHKTPAHNWTIEGLASTAAMSRTAFANAFKEQSGWTPVQYLTWWRMQLAWSRLSKGDNVAAVAASVGYQSEAAFSRVFKNEFSITAGEVRRGAMSHSK